MASISFRGVRKHFGKTHVIKGVDIEINDGEFCVFVGPSGCGKSTLLRLIAGLEDVSGGDLSIGGTRVNDLAPSKRGVAIVFQSYALYPHMTVYDNMAFGLKLAHQSKEEIDRRVREAARVLQIEPLLERLPRQLSGGQRQRVAIGRAITRQPKVFLFDEPLSNLDAALRVQTRIEIANLHGRLKTTMVYVTHDQVEAMTLADKIVVLNAGNVAQVGAPLELYHHPKNLFVAGFIGSPQMNFLKGNIVEASAKSATVALTDNVRIVLPVDASRAKKDEPVTLGVRPEHMRVAEAGEASEEGSVLRGEMRLVEHLGEVSFLYVSTPASDTPVVVRQRGDSDSQPESVVPMFLPAGSCHLFDDQGQAFTRLQSSSGDAPPVAA